MTSRPPSSDSPQRLAPWAWVAMALLVLSAGLIAAGVFLGTRHADALHYLVTGQALSGKETRSVTESLLAYGLGSFGVWLLVAFGLRWLSRKQGETAPVAFYLRKAATPFTSWWLGAPILLLARLGEIDGAIRSACALCLGLFLAMVWRLFRYWPLTVWINGERSSEAAETRAIRLPARWSLEARVLAVCAVAYFVAFTAMSWLRHMNFYSLLTDQGIYTQIAWSILHGRGFHCTVYKELVNSNMLSEHVMPIMLLLAPFYAIWSDPRMLLLLQSIAVTLAVWPIYRTALWFSGEGDETSGHRPFALALALSYLLHPQLQTAHLFDFHPDAFLPLFLGLSIWALLRRNWALYWPALVLALMCKEDTAMTVAMLGLYAALFRRRRLSGVLTFVLGVVWFVVTVKVISPHYRGDEYRHMGQYAHLIAPFVEGSPDNVGFAQLFWILLTHPGAVCGQLLGFPQLEGLSQMFGPTLGVSLLAPAELVLAGPHLLATLLSDDPFKQGLHFHYAFTMLTAVYAAAAAGGSTIARWIGSREATNRGAVFAFLSAAVLASSLLTCHWHGEAPFSQGFAKIKYRLDERWANGREFLRQVPRGAAVSAQHDVAPHLTNRAKVYDYPTVKDAEVIVLNLHTLQRKRPVWTFHSRQYYCETVGRTLESGEWGLTARSDGFVMLERGADTSRNHEVLETIRSFLPAKK